ncbi:hypothetical protein EVAR_4253_1 [Eumeta japonica]|uniref:Uncharacterized protein n=1 Tax=Eumeta variegata TaxID=151549 RepID=A0A4C1ZA30_EUMVA|nr:hypothetical protein EVAR_4253_1 [Eumeta japonica]
MERDRSENSFEASETTKAIVVCDDLTHTLIYKLSKLIKVLRESAQVAFVACFEDHLTPLVLDVVTSWVMTTFNRHQYKLNQFLSMENNTIGRKALKAEHSPHLCVSEPTLEVAMLASKLPIHVKRLNSTRRRVERSCRSNVAELEMRRFRRRLLM